MIVAAAPDPTTGMRLAQLHAASFASSWTAEAILALMSTPGALALEHRDGDAARGFILLRTGGGEAEILTLAVAPPWRRQGVARTLVEAALIAAAGQAEAIWLEVAADNAGALALYAGAGFEAVGRRPGYYRAAQGAGADAVVMRRTLNSVAS